MATYVIGDIQGCWTTFQRLLDRIAFDPQQDRLWSVGDIVNRGPNSLEMLRWMVRTQHAVTAVLGNHELHLLAVAFGASEARDKDTLGPILNAPERDDLIEWVASLPLVHHEETHWMVHAGFLPDWTEEEILRFAKEAEDMLRGPQRKELLSHWHNKATTRMKDTTDPIDRAAFLLHVFTRMRVCSPEGRLDLEFKSPPGESPPGYAPWFSHEHKRDPQSKVYFGHWAALGLHVGKDVVGMDSGCVWGKELTAYRIENGAVFHELSAY
jgi:bis(5'-nucleosyl)-tetraphosphatase (symmetrical)